MFFALNHLLHFYRGTDAARPLPAPAATRFRRSKCATARCWPRTTGSSSESHGRSRRSPRPAGRFCRRRRKRRAYAAARRHDLDDRVRAVAWRVLSRAFAAVTGSPGGAHGTAATVASDTYGVIGAYIATLAGFGPRDVSGWRRGACCGFAAASLPFQFLPDRDHRQGKVVRTARPSRRWPPTFRKWIRLARPRSCRRSRRDDARGDHRRRPRHGARRDARRELAPHARWRVRDPAGHGVRYIGLSQPRRRRGRHGRRGRGHHAASSAGAGRAAIGSASRRLPKRSPIPACLTAQASIDRGSACFSARARRTCSGTKSSTRTWITKGLGRTRRSDLWNHFPSTPVDVIAERVRLRRSARVRRRGMLVEHDCHRPRRRGDSERARRRGAGGRNGRAVAADVQRLQSAAADGPGAVPAVRSQPGRHEHRRRRGHPGARASRSGPCPRRPHLRRAGRPRCRLRGVSSDGARAGRQARGGGRRARAAGCGHQRRRRAARQCARHGHAAERRCRGARVSPRVRRPGAHAFPSRRSSR